MDTTTPASARQRQRARKHAAQHNARLSAEKQDLAYQKEIKRLNKMIGELQKLGTLMDSRLQSFAGSSALDAGAIVNQKEQIARLITCNQKWEREGIRPHKENQRLRSERNSARSQNQPSPRCPVSSPASRHYCTGTPSPPLTPRTPGRSSPSLCPPNP